MISLARHIQTASRSRNVAAGILACRRTGLPSPADHALADGCASGESASPTLVASLSGGRDARPPRQAGMPAATAFSLIEVLIAVTLMSVIVVGLMAMFGETQRAFRTGMNQVDIMEGGRSALELMAREVEQVVATDQAWPALNFAVRLGSFSGSAQLGYPPPSLGSYSLVQELPGTPSFRTNVLQDLVFTTREGQEWRGIGYAVIYTNYLGTLYRYETNLSAVRDNWQFAAAIGYDAFIRNNPNAVAYSKVLENVVHYQVRTYDSRGRFLSFDWRFESVPKDVISFRRALRTPDDMQVEFYSNAIPAYVEIELGVLDTKIAGRARAIGEDSLSAQRLYLEKQAGSVQIFRRRVPIRNVDPSVYQ